MATQQNQRKSFEETTKKVGDKVKDAAGAVAEKAEGAASFIGQKADDAAGAVGGRMQSAAGSLRKSGPQEGMFGNASSALANTLENYGRELQEHGLTGMADDVTNMIRRHPVPAIFIGIGVGFLFARLFTK